MKSFILMNLLSVCCLNLVAQSTCAEPIQMVEATEFLVVHSQSGEPQWYAYTAPEDQVITVSTCGKTSQDTKIVPWIDCETVYDHSRYPLAGDDDCGAQSEVKLSVLKDQTYLIEFSTDWLEPKRVNYIAALTIEDGYEGFTCETAVEALPGVNDVDNSIGGQWFTYTFASAGEVTLSTCDSGEDTIIALYASCEDAHDHTLNVSDDDCGLQSSLTVQGQEGETYYFLLEDTYDPGPYAFTLEESLDEVLGLDASDIKVFPNPTSDLVQIDLGRALDAEVKIVGMGGNVLSEAKYAQGRIISEGLSGPSGIYFLLISTGKESYKIRVVKE